VTSPKPVTLAQAAARYLKTVRVPSTRTTYEQALNEMQAGLGPGTPLADITPAAVAEWLEELAAERDWSDATVTIRMRGIRMAAAYWHERGLADENLGSALKPPRKPRARRPPEVLSPEEMQALLAQCSRKSATGARNRAMIMLLYASGLRVSELVAVKPSDLDWDARQIRLGVPKNGQPGVREWHPVADDAIQRWIDWRKKAGITRGPLICVLSGPGKGGALDRRAVWRTISALVRKAGITKDIGPHDLRHTFARELRREGTDTATIGELLGQESLAATQRYVRRIAGGQPAGALAGIPLTDPETRQDKPAQDDLAAKLDALQKQLDELRAEREK
jgi:integrase/recombinase XerD